MADFEIVPLTEAPSQTTNVTLNQQACRINVFTKPINWPILPPDMIASDPDPVYENANPVFLDLYLNNTLVVAGVICRNATRIVRNTYFGFIGDLAFYDTEGDADPYGVPARLPPMELRNYWQRHIPLTYGGYAPPNVAGKCPGMGTRFQLTYWPDIA